MTCVVGLVHKDRAYIGGDSAAVEEMVGGGISIRPGSKVFRLPNGIIVGFAGSFRMGQIVRYQMVEMKPVPTEEWVVTVFVPNLFAALRDSGYKKMELPGELLLGIKDQLYNIEMDMHVGTSQCYLSIGSANMIALGALYATTGKPPKVRIEMALKAAEYHSTGVRSPFSIEST